MTKYPKLLFVALIMLAGCQSEQPTTDAQLGEIDLPFQGSAAVMPAFERGLLLLHSFEYEDAREAFMEAQEADSTFAMAIWGEALTYNHGLWQRQDYGQGRTALFKLGASPEARQARGTTELEKDLIGGLELLYGDNDNKVERDQAYADYMAALNEKYPNNSEVASFYALSLLSAVPFGRDASTFEQGAQIAQKVLDENPRHPGALHYLIHSYDDPEHAELALQAANSYSKVAPDAAHALHMPSHIYVALGMWDEVINSNIASYEASVKRMERKGLDDNARSFHAYQWLEYGHLQKGNFAEAEKIMADMEGFIQQEKPSKQCRSYLIAMKGAYLAETDNWLHPIGALKTPIADLGLVVKAQEQFINGMRLLKQGKLDTLNTLIDSMEYDRKQAAFMVGDKGIAMCSAGGQSSNKVNKLDLGQAEVMELELRGLLAKASQQKEEAERYLRKAVEIEQSLNYSYGPPVVFVPSFELYGQWLLDEGRNEEARTQFNYALKRGPGRRLAVSGSEKAL